MNPTDGNLLRVD